MAVELPENINSGIVTGTLLAAVQDGDDADTNPDGTPLIGTVTFFPVPSSIVADGIIVVPNPVPIILDGNGSFAVSLIACEWTASFNLDNGNLADFPFTVLAGETIDLSSAIIQIAPSDGLIYLPGPPPVLNIGSVTTGAPGSSALVSITGGAGVYSLNFTIPTGITGSPLDSGSFMAPTVTNDVNSVAISSKWGKNTDGTYFYNAGGAPVDKAGILEILSDGTLGVRRIGDADDTVPAGGGGSLTITGLGPQNRYIKAYNDAFNAAVITPAHKVYNVVDTYGADPTNTTDSSAAFLAMCADLNALPETAGAMAYIPYGNYKINTATRLTFDGSGLSIQGDGIGATRLNFTHADGGVTIGNFISSTSGGFMRDLTLDGGDVAKNLLHVGWTNGREFANIRMFNGGFLPADTQAARDRSACMIIELSQNCFFTNVQAKQSLGHGIIFGRGTGGHLFSVLQINEVNELDRTDLYHLWTVQGPTTDPYGGTPQNIKILQGFFEGVLQNQLNVMRFDAADAIKVEVQTSCSSRYPNPITFAYVGPTCSNMTFDDCLFRGNNAGAGPTKVATGIFIAAGAKFIRITSPEFANTLWGINSEATGQVILDGAPLFTSSVGLVTGTQPRLIIKDFILRASAITGLPAPSLDYLGVRAILTPSGTATPDAFYMCLRVDGVYSWVSMISSGGSLTDKLGTIEEFEVVSTSGPTRTLLVTNASKGIRYTGGVVNVSGNPSSIVMPPALLGASYTLRLKATTTGRTYTIAPTTGETIKWLNSTNTQPASAISMVGKEDYHSFTCYATGVWAAHPPIIGV